MPEITFTVSAANMTRLVNATLTLTPVEAGWTGGDDAWNREVWRRKMKAEIRRAEESTARENINVDVSDDTIT
jgi:hypothetical protein